MPEQPRHQLAGQLQTTKFNKNGRYIFLYLYRRSTTFRTCSFFFSTLYTRRTRATHNLHWTWRPLAPCWRSNDIAVTSETSFSPARKKASARGRHITPPGMFALERTLVTLSGRPNRASEPQQSWSTTLIGDTATTYFLLSRPTPSKRAILFWLYPMCACQIRRIECGVCRWAYIYFAWGRWVPRVFWV